MRTRIPQFTLERQHAEMANAIEGAIGSVVRSNRFIGGPEIEAFEREWAEFCGKRFCIAVASGTIALTIAMEACGWMDTMVSVPALTFTASAEAIVRSGNRPFFVDEGDPPSGRHVAVHLYGEPRVPPYVGAEYIDDSSHAHGARGVCNGRASCFSFYPSKPLGALGDAGAIVTDDGTVAYVARELREHGRIGADAEGSLLFGRVGHNARMDALHAAVLRAKLPHVIEWGERRRAIAAMYRAGLMGHTERLGFSVPNEAPTGAWHQYAIRVKGGRRERLRRHLAEHGIEARVHYAPILPLQPAYAQYARGSYPKAEAMSREVLSLPMFPELTDSEVMQVCEAIGAWQ